MNGFRLTERDKLVFKEFLDHGFLSARQLTILEYFPNEKKCRDRLRVLNKEGYVGFCQKPGFGRGRAEYVYYLNKGRIAEITQLLGCALEEACNIKPSSSLMLLHRLAIVDFVICVRQACKKFDSYEAEIIPEYKRWQEKQARMKKAISQSVVFKGKNFEIIPDGVVCLSRKNDNAKTLLMFEIYRGTQTMEGGRHTIQNKIEAYVAYLEQKLYEHFSERLEYSFNGFRVLFIVNSLSSLEKLRAICFRVAPAGLFWLATVDEIKPETFFKPVWHVPGEDGLKALVKGGD